MTTNARPLPTRRDEAWRYADLDALARLWPLPAPESVIVPAHGVYARTIVQDAGGVVQIALSLGREARAVLHILNIGGEYGRVELDVTLHQGADFTLGCAQIGGQRQVLELVTDVTHAEGGATSRQTVRSVLGGAATGSYLGKVAVARGSDGTDSTQDAKAILLDRSATANAKPELEIYADDVKCAHGATVGELDENARFYMAARGLAPEAARRLLVQAFIGDALAALDDEAEHERLMALALARLDHEL